MTRAPDRFMQATAALLVASVVLIGPSLLGLGGSLVLALALAVLAGVLFAVRERLATVGVVGSVPFGAYLAIAWTGPLVASVLVLVALEASPGEIQALGGLCGLVGMANYFLRPVFAFALSAGRSIDRRLG